MSSDRFCTGITRLNTVMSLFQAKRSRYSILDVATMLKVPVGVIRDDIASLHECREIPVTFCFCDDKVDDLYEEDFAVAIRTGDYDEEELELLTSEKADIFLALSSLEYKCLKELEDNNESWELGIHRNFVTKPLYNQARVNMQVKASEMQSVIDAQRSIRIRYITRSKKTVAIDIRPLQLVHVEIEDLYYVITIHKGSISPFRLDKIRGFDLIDTEIEVEDTSVLQDLTNMWGMELGERIHVKILIRNEGRVQEKVKMDLSNRINGSWTKSGDNLIFEDDVIGIGSFRSWLNGYGSSVLVLEPISLRNEIIESAKKRLEKYEKVQ